MNENTPKPENFFQAQLEKINKTVADYQKTVEEKWASGEGGIQSVKEIGLGAGSILIALSLILVSQTDIPAFNATFTSLGALFGLAGTGVIAKNTIDLAMRPSEYNKYK